MVTIAHASKDEHGVYQGGQAGDQTGFEVCLRSWYNRPWTHVIRFNDSKMANKVAEAMEKAAKNDHIGYDQFQRNTLLTHARKVGYDPGRVTVDCETDCSALVSVACMYAGVKESVLYVSGNSSTTRSIRQRLSSTGLVKIFTDAEYTARTDHLRRGDILLCEGHHVAVVTGNTAAHKKTIDEVVVDVLAGKYGDGNLRKARLTAEGYDPAVIQAEVNKRIKGE